MPTTAFQVIEMSTAQAVGAIRSGLPVGDFDRVAKILSLTTDVLATKLGISPRTVRDQRKKVGRLSMEISEKLVRIARIQRLARTLFTTDAAVSQWLSSPAPALDGLLPLDLLDTDTGAREVEATLHGIAHGNVM